MQTLPMVRLTSKGFEFSLHKSEGFLSHRTHLESLFALNCSTHYYCHVCERVAVIHCAL